MNLVAAPAWPARTRHRRPGTFPAALVTAVAVVTLVGSSDGILSRDEALAGRPWAVLIVILTSGLIVAGAWAARAAGPRVSAGMATGGITAMVPAWSAWSWLPPRLAAAFLATTALVAAGLAQVALGRPRSASPVVLRGPAVVYAFAGAATLVHLLGYNPFADPGCTHVCADVRPLLDGLVTTRTAVALCATLTVITAIVGGYCILRARVWRTHGWVAWASLVGLIAVAISAGVRWIAWDVARPQPVRFVVEPAAAALVGAALIAMAIGTARTRAAVQRLVARLSEHDAAPSIAGGAIRGVAFAVPGEDRWVDAAGRPAVDDPPRATHLILSDEDGPVVRFTMARPTDESETLAGLSPAALLTLRNAQLTAVVRAHVDEVRASQRRVIATADAERRRIERDLHDGAQQRLVGVAIHLNVALSDTDADAADLHVAAVLISDALADLRRVTHRIHPRALVDEGLGAALDDLTAAADRPVALDVRLLDDGADSPFGAEAAMAVYATVAAALTDVAASTGATHAEVSVVRDKGELTVRVDIHIRGHQESILDLDSALADAADRVGAAGGDLRATARACGPIVVSAVIPCGS